MNNIMNTAVWYANDARNDKYVTCMSSMVEQIRLQGVSVAGKWLEVTGNLELKKRFTLRRRYWLLVVRLRYAECKGSEGLVNDVLDIVWGVIKTLDDVYTLRMYQALEIACYLSLYRVSDGRVLPIFRYYHSALLGIVDDFMEMPRESVPARSFGEDCGHVFNLAEDIEKVCGSKLYLGRSSASGRVGDHSVVHFNSGEARRLDKILNYAVHWLGHTKINADKSLIKELLTCVEMAKRQIDKRLSINTDILFYEGVAGDNFIRGKIKQSRDYMIEALKQEGVSLERGSFWQLYIELIVQQSINRIGRDKFNSLNRSRVLRQTASWPLHEKIHSLIPALAGNPAYVKKLVDNQLIKSESLLYSIFSTLAMQNIPVVYCEYDVLESDSLAPTLKLNRYNGGVLEGLYGELLDLVYAIGRCRKGEGFCLRLPQPSGDIKQSLDMACVCTDHQLVMVGMPKDFTMNKHHYYSSEGILGRLFGLVGFEFATHERLAVQGSCESALPSCRQQCAQFSSCNIDTCTGFVNNFVEATISLEKRGSMTVLKEKTASESSYMADMIDVARRD